MKPDSSAEVIARRNLMIGKWYSEHPTKDGLLQKSLLERRRDGTYTIQFQLFKGATKTLDQFEAGIWGISGNIYFTAAREMLDGQNFESVDTTDAHYYDAYTILKLEQDSFSYRHLETQNLFSTRRVPDSFRL